MGRLCNALNNPDLPLWEDTTLLTDLIDKADPNYVGLFIPNDDKVLEWTAPYDFEYYYIMTKWGQGQANFDHALHYMLAGETVTYNPGGTRAPQGLSHVIQGGGERKRVPDGGSMLALLGLGLTSIEALRRKLSGSKA